MTGKKAVLFGAGAIVLIVLVVKTVYFLVDLFQPNRLPSQDWAIFQENFISPEGRVIDTGNANVSHSEGQGYGLIIAEAYGDRKAFDRIWEWTQKNLQTRPDDKLLSWQWTPDGKNGGAVSDPNNASDGDLLVAWALVRAHRQWGDYKYQQAAAQILTDLAKLDVVELQDDGLIFLPGTIGFAHDGIFTLNLSYYVFPAFRELGEVFPGSPWQALNKSGQALVTKASFGKYGLTPDWIQLAGQVVPAVSAVAVPVSAEPSATSAESPASTPVASPTPADDVPAPDATATPEAVAAVTPVAAEEPASAPTPSEAAPVSSTEPLAKAGQVEVSSKFPPDFGYNAVRIPLHLAWQDPRSPELIPFANFWKQFPPDKLPATVNVVTGVVGPDPALPGMQAIAALTIACVDKRDLTVRSLPVLTKGEPYFSASLSILTKIAVRELFAK